jgi:hypothetical protein
MRLNTQLIIHAVAPYLPGKAHTAVTKYANAWLPGG